MVQIEGLDEFIRDLNLAPSQMQKARQTFVAYSAQMVAEMAVARGHAEGSTARKAADDIRVAGPGLVELGGRAYDLGAEFGSYQYHQFERWRGKDDDAGYFFWPAVREYRDNLMSNQWLETVWKMASIFSNSE